jgi:hypothetical protein
MGGSVALLDEISEKLGQNRKDQSDTPSAKRDKSKL